MTLHEEQEKVQRAMNTALSGVREDPWLARRVLAQGKGEKPMKKKISVVVLLAAALMMITAVAFAATSWTGIADFLEKIVGGWQVNGDAIVTPVIRSCESKWLKLSATEAYWAEDGLSIVLKVEAADDRHAVVYGFEDGLLDEDGERSGRIWIDGELLSLDEWRQGREVVVSEFVLNQEGWEWYHRDGEDLFVILNVRHVDAEQARAGMEITLEAACENLQTGEAERSPITLSLPQMTMQPGHP